MRSGARCAAVAACFPLAWASPARQIPGPLTVADSHLEWSTPFTSVLDGHRPPHYRWFPGGELNVCHNAVDRHVAAGHGESRHRRGAYRAPGCTVREPYDAESPHSEAASPHGAAAITRSPTTLPDRRRRAHRDHSRLAAHAQPGHGACAQPSPVHPCLHHPTNARSTLPHPLAPHAPLQSALPYFLSRQPQAPAGWARASHARIRVECSRSV
eukprot:scaffold10897_cov102-Isochrysis_galbana.AAC.3